MITQLHEVAVDKVSRGPSASAEHVVIETVCSKRNNRQMKYNR